MRPLAVALAALLAGCVWSEHEDGIRVDVAVTHEHVPAAGPDAHAYVALASIEILPCVGARHGRGTPTRLGVPLVEDLLARAPAQAEPLGTLGAPPGRYCSARVTIGPADSDAIGLPGADMVGLSALLAGASCATSKSAVVTLDPPVEVGDDAREAELVLVVDSTAALAGVDASTRDAGCVVAEQAAAAIRRRF
jgi:hypothetical protein